MTEASPSEDMEQEIQIVSGPEQRWYAKTSFASDLDPFVKMNKLVIKLRNGVKCSFWIHAKVEEPYVCRDTCRESKRESQRSGTRHRKCHQGEASPRVQGSWHKYPRRVLNRALRQCWVAGTRPDARDVWSRLEIASGAINEVRKRRVSALPGTFWGKGWGTLTSRRSESRNPPRRALPLPYPLLRTLNLSLPPLSSLLLSFLLFSSLLFPSRVSVCVSPSNLFNHLLPILALLLLLLLLFTPTFTCVHVRQTRYALFVLSFDLSQCPSSFPLPSSLPSFFNRSFLFLLRDISILSFV